MEAKKRQAQQAMVKKVNDDIESLMTELDRIETGLLKDPQLQKLAEIIDKGEERLKQKLSFEERAYQMETFFTKAIDKYS